MFFAERGLTHSEGCHSPGSNQFHIPARAFNASHSLSHSSRALSQADPQGGRFLPRRGPGGQAECHRINVTQMALTWTDPVTSIGFPQPQRAGRLVSYLLHSTLLCTDRVSVICLFLAPGQAAGDTVTINSVTRWAAVRTV